MLRPDDRALTASQQANVEKHADRLLKEAGAYGVFPTPIGTLLAAAKLTVVEDEFLDENMLLRFLRKATARGAATLKSALSKVWGLFEPHDRLVMIDKDVPDPAKPFVKLHEAGHGFLPHQSGLFALIHDCKKTLDPDTTDLFESEANAFAVETLFQGTTFATEAFSDPFGIKVPMALAKKYGASRYSTFRRYVSANPIACCVVVLEPIVLQPDGGFTAEVRRIIASQTFATMYDTGTFFSAITNKHPLGHMIPVRRKMTAARKIYLVDRNKDQRQCQAEAFDTRHQIFLLIRDMGVLKKTTVFVPTSADIAALAKRL